MKAMIDYTGGGFEFVISLSPSEKELFLRKFDLNVMDTMTLEVCSEVDSDMNPTGEWCLIGASDLPRDTDDQADLAVVKEEPSDGVH